MLIDAAHAEETRVAVVDGSRVEEFDFESRAKKQLRGNIYLAKITRVEPSLQAAFVEYGGNRHGFLAFNEIHPDYYQIPVADREALLREEAEENAAHHARNGRHHEDAEGEGEDSVGDDDDDVMEEELERRRRRLLRRYKIQEVIKRRQIMLVQVVKDERGAKGASLTTYLSLAGRYCVLMPNTARGGGISRKIASAVDRKRLKGVIQSLEVPDGMGLIVRTAGAKRTKAEIKRDYEYLLRLWEDIREKTLNSIAPALIYEEEDLVKRAIRDMYDKDVDGIVVEGEDGFREAREFMRMLMPSQAKKIQPYREAAPLFVKYRIEDNLAQIYNPVAPLRSGGYLVINQTEALVAIDVNSGKSTRERGIEATALKTNLEAAEEAARQLRLRDLAGLIVIDFIDMDEAKNNRLVEKKLKDCLKDDRARIQMGKISGFGLMELSRQRRRTGVLEGTTHVCAHCNGVGRVRSPESSALAALRAVEIEAAKRGPGAITLRVPTAVALYILNEKRMHLAKLQEQQHLFVQVQLDDTIGTAEHQIERTSSLDTYEAPPAPEPLSRLPEPDDADLDVFDEEDEEDEEEEEEIEAEANEGGEGGRAEDGVERHGRRRRRRGRRGEERAEAAPRGEAEAPALVSASDDDDEHGEAGGRHGRRRRRGRRGGRRGHEEVRQADAYGWTRARTPDGADPYGWYDTAPTAQTPSPANDQAPAAAAPESAAAKMQEPAEIWVELPAEPETKSRSRRGRGRKSAEAPADVAEASVEAVAETPVEATVEAQAPEAPAAEAAPPANEPGEPQPKRARRSRAKAAAEPAPSAEAPAPEPEPEPELETVAAAPAPPAEPDPNEVSGRPAAPRRGWWRKGG
jgi:ribonuclease E